MDNDSAPTISNPARAVAAPLPTSPVGMGRAAAGGMAWMVGLSVIGRLTGFGAQIVLGWILSEGDFGVYAIAISVGALVQIFREGGLREVVIHRGGDWERLQGGYFWITLALHVFAGLLLLGIIPLATAIYSGVPQLGWLLAVIAVATPLIVPAAVLQTKLQIDLRFRDVARIQGLASLIRQAAAIILALSGFGPLSFVLPLLVSGSFESIAAYAAVRQAPWRSPLNLPEWRMIWRQSGWAVAGALVSLLMVSGDYMVLGTLEDEAVVGVYFFAFQLAVQVHTLVLGSLQGVLLPVLSKLKDDTARFAAALLQAQSTTALLVFPATFALAVVATPLEQVIWRGRWAAAVPVMQVLCLALPLRSLAATERSVLEANGAFKTYALVGGIDGLLNMAAAAIGATVGGLRAISVVIAVYLSATAVLHAAVIGRQIRAGTWTVLAGQLRPMFAAAVAGAAAISVNWPAGPLGLIVARGVIMAGLYAMLARLLMPAELGRLLSLFHSLRSRGSSALPVAAGEHAPGAV